MATMLHERPHEARRLAELRRVAFAPYRGDDGPGHMVTSADVQVRYGTLRVRRLDTASYDTSPRPRRPLWQREVGLMSAACALPSQIDGALIVALDASALKRCSLGPDSLTMSLGRRAQPLEPGPAFEEVLRAAQHGAPWACQHLYEAMAGRVCGYLRAHAAPEPEDLTSEVFLRVFDHLPRFTGGEPQFRAWIFTIAHRLLIDDLRRRRVRPQTRELSGPVAESLVAGDAELDAMASVGAAWVEDSLAVLPPDQRAVLTLRIVADLTVDQVAKVLGKRPGAIKALQRRGLAALRRQLEGAAA